MLALTIALAVLLVSVAAFRLRAAWRNVDAMIAAHATPAAGRSDRESAVV